MERAKAKTAKPRNNYIDFCRGLAAISVIFIHTVWWSGAAYVPDYLRTFSLIFEVPVFFFLAGWSYSFSSHFKKALRNLWHLHVQYLIFIVVFLALLAILGSNSLTLHNILAWSLHDYVPTDKIPVVMGSFWFIGVYICVVLACMALIAFLTKRQLVYGILLFACLTFYFQLTSLRLQGGIFDIIRPDYIIFYSIFYVLGYLLSNAHFKHWILAPLLIVLDIIVLLSIGVLGSVNLSDLQHLKFPPTIIYLLWSLPGIILLFACKKRFENMSSNFISYIGTIAIYMFFAQGLSSSLLFYILPFQQSQPWPLRLVINFSLNLVLACMLALILKHIILKSDVWLSATFAKADVRIRAMSFGKEYSIKINDLFRDHLNFIWMKDRTARLPVTVETSEASEYTGSSGADERT